MPRSQPPPVVCRTRLLPPVVPGATFAVRQERISVGQQLPLELHLILHERQRIGKRVLAPQGPWTEHSQLKTSAVGNARFPANSVWLAAEHSHDRPVNADHRCPCLPILGSVHSPRGERLNPRSLQSSSVWLARTDRKTATRHGDLAIGAPTRGSGVPFP